MRGLAAPVTRREADHHVAHLRAAACCLAEVLALHVEHDHGPGESQEVGDDEPHPLAAPRGCDHECVREGLGHEERGLVLGITELAQDEAGLGPAKKAVALDLAAGLPSGDAVLGQLLRAQGARHEEPEEDSRAYDRHDDQELPRLPLLKESEVVAKVKEVEVFDRASEPPGDVDGSRDVAGRCPEEAKGGSRSGEARCLSHGSPLRARAQAARVSGRAARERRQASPPAGWATWQARRAPGSRPSPA